MCLGRLVALSFLLCSSISAQQLQWSEPIIINSGNLNSSGVRPRIAIDSQNNPLIIWGKTGSQKNIHFSRIEGGAFTPPVALLLEDINPHISTFSGPEIAVKSDTVYIVFSGLNSLEEEHIYLLKSTNGGVDFSDAIQVDNLTYGKAVMPHIAISSGGNPVVSFMHVNSNWTETNHMITQSYNGAISFEEIVSASSLSGNNPCECCFSKVVCDEDRYAVVFRDNDDNIRNMHASLSTNNGESFETFINLNDQDWVLEACPDAGPDAYLIGNHLFSVWRSGSSGNPLIHYAKLNLNSYVLEERGIIDEVFSIFQKFPDLSGNTDTILAVWTDNRYGSNDCFISYSTDGMTTWSDSEAFSDTLISNTFSEPDVAYANGKIHVVYRNVTQQKVLYRTGQIVYPNSILENKNSYLNILDEEVEWGREVDFELFNLEGKMVVKGKSHKLSLIGLPNSIYILKTPTSVHKFIKE